MTTRQSDWDGSVSRVRCQEDAAGGHTPPGWTPANQRHGHTDPLARANDPRRPRGSRAAARERTVTCRRCAWSTVTSSDPAAVLAGHRGQCTKPPASSRAKAATEAREARVPTIRCPRCGWSKKSAAEPAKVLAGHNSRCKKSKPKSVNRKREPKWKDWRTDETPYTAKTPAEMHELRMRQRGPSGTDPAVGDR